MTGCAVTWENNATSYILLDLKIAWASFMLAQCFSSLNSARAAQWRYIACGNIMRSETASWEKEEQFSHHDSAALHTYASVL